MVTDQNLHLRMQALMGIQEDIQNKNSYRPHVRSEAGYDITQTTVVIKTTAESGMQVPLFSCAFLLVTGYFGSSFHIGYSALTAFRSAKEAIMRVKKTRQSDRGVYRYPVQVEDGRALQDAYNNLENVVDPDLIDCYIYELNSVQMRYKFLLASIKKMELSQ